MLVLEREKKFHPVITWDKSSHCGLHSRVRRRLYKSMRAYVVQASFGAEWFPERLGNRAPCSQPPDMGSPVAGEPYPKPNFLPVLGSSF